MSLSIKLFHGEESIVAGDSGQGFVCFQWQKPLQRYIDRCWITCIEVKLEGYVVSSLVSGIFIHKKKIFSKDLVLIKGSNLYGKKPLGKLFQKRSLEHPFIYCLPCHMVPSCHSDHLLSVVYKFKCKVVICDPLQGARHPDFTEFTREFPLEILAPKLSNPSFTLPVLSNDAEDLAENPLKIVVNLSKSIVKGGDVVEANLTLHDPSNHKSIRLLGQLVQECYCEDETVHQSHEIFQIKLDESEDSQSNLTIPFEIPNPMLPTVVEKNQHQKITCFVKVSVLVGKMHLSRKRVLRVPLIVVP